jgi:hypothetical protein
MNTTVPPAFNQDTVYALAQSAGNLYAARASGGGWPGAGIRPTASQPGEWEGQVRYLPLR